jgi:hypothetical protein
MKSAQESRRGKKGSALELDGTADKTEPACNAGAVTSSIAQI